MSPALPVGPSITLLSLRSREPCRHLSASGSEPLPQIIFPKAAQSQPAHLLAFMSLVRVGSRGLCPVHLCRTHLASFLVYPQLTKCVSPFSQCRPRLIPNRYCSGLLAFHVIPGLPGPPCETHQTFTPLVETKH